MRGAGQIAELAEIAEPDVGVIVNVGPVHLELLGHDRGDRRGEGRADRRPAPRRDRGRARRRAAARPPPARRPATSSPSARAATSPSSGGARARRSTSRAHAPQRARRARRRARRRRRAGGRVDGRAQRAARPADRAARRGHRHRRLLQRQPDVDARRPRRPRRVPPPARRVAVLGDMLELGPDELRFHARDRRARRATRGVDVLVTVGPLAAHMGGATAARCTPSPTPRRPRRSCPSSCGPATRCSSRRRAASASRPSPRRCARRPAVMGEVLIARHGVAAHLHLPVAEVHRVPARARVRPAHPRGGARGPPRQGGTPTMGGIIIFAAISIPFLMLVATTTGARSASSARRSPARCSASPTTT